MKHLLIITCLILCLGFTAQASDELLVHTMVHGATEWDFDGIVSIAGFVLSASHASTASNAIIWDATSADTTTLIVPMIAAAKSMSVVMFPVDREIRLTDKIIITSSGTGVVEGRLQIYYR